MKEFQERIQKFIQQENLFAKKTPVLIALSGGVDSSVMVHLFHEGGLNFGIAHINFQLRGNNSDADEVFVKSLAESMGKKFFSTQFSTGEFAEEKKISIQMAARELRYQWLEETRRANGFHFIATAHHLDDSIETTLFNIIRGTGIHGLHGILPKQGKIIRPMLCFFKKEIEEFAAENDISFRQDQSNFKTDYDRNKIRLEVVPVIERYFPSFRKTFAENIERWADAGLLLNQAITRAKKKISEKQNEEVLFSIPSLQSHPSYKTLLFEALREFSFNSDQVEQIIYALNSESGKLFFSPTHRLLKDRKHLIVSPITTAMLSEVLIYENELSVAADKIQLHISDRDAKDFRIPKSPLFICIDKSKLEFPLVLRKWKKGDYFYPLGMNNKKKKISDYLIDRKIPLTEKENIWVIESGKRIACIIGERIDERFKITSGTEKIWMTELVKTKLIDTLPASASQRK